MTVRQAILLILALGQMAVGQDIPLDGPWVVRVYFQDDSGLRELVEWREPWTINRIEGFVTFKAGIQDLEYLTEKGFRHEIDGQYSDLLYHYQQPEDGSGGIPGFPCYQTVEETFAMAEQLVLDYPTMAQWVDIGDSWEKQQNPDNGYDLKVLRLTNSAFAGEKPKLMLVSGIHAREFAPVGLTTGFALWLLQNYNVDADATWILNFHEIHLLFYANPDGRKMAEQQILWRKNKDNDFCPNSDDRGIDLNRNFLFQWGCCGGASGLACAETYRGPSPASEPETQAIINYERSIFPDQRGDNLDDPAPPDATGVFIDIHSYGEWVLWPYGFDGDVPTPNGDSLQSLGRKFAWFNGYWPERASTSFNTDGTTDDFAYGDLGVAAFTFEVGNWFFQDCETFESTIYPDNFQALLYAAKVARTPYMTAVGPDVTSPTFSCSWPVSGQLVRLSALIDATRFSNLNGVEPIHVIAGARAWLDVAPWEPGASALALSPVDGSLNSSSEEMELFFDTTGLAPGRHLVYLDAEDDQGNIGAVSALFLQVSPQFSLNQWPDTVTVLELIPHCTSQ